MFQKTNYLILLLCFCSLLLTNCTKDTGTIQVHYQEATAVYGDMDEIRNKDLIAASRDIVNPGKLFIGDDFILIGEEGHGVHVIDNSDRQNPINTMFIDIPGNKEFYVDNSILYAESFYDVVKIDIQNPKQPIMLDRARNAVQNEFTDDKGDALIGFEYEEKTVELNEDDDFYKEVIGDQLVYFDFARNIIPNSAVPSSFAGNSSAQIGTVNRMTKTKGHIYLISNTNMIVIPDNHNFSTNAKRILNLQQGMETIFPYEEYLFVGSRTSMAIYDTEFELRPQQVSEFEHARSCDPVLPHEDVAYVTLRTADFSDCPGNINGLLVVDIHNVNNVDLLTEIEMTSPYGMTVIGTDLYVGEGENGLKIFDISNRKKPKLKTQHDFEAYDIIADPFDNRIVFIAGPHGLSQFEIEGNNEVLDLQSTLSY